MNRLYFLVFIFFLLSFGQLSAQNVSNSYSVERLDINSGGSEIAPIMLPNGLVFISNREDEIGVTRVSKLKSEPFFKVYFSRYTETGLGKPIKLAGDLNKRFSEGPASFSADGKSVFFTRNIPLKFSTKTGKKARMGIYSGSFHDNIIDNIKEFPHNKADFSLGQPCLSPNGNFII